MKAPVLWRQRGRHGFEGGHHHGTELGAEDILVPKGGVFNIHLSQTPEIFENWGVFVSMFFWGEELYRWKQSSKIL